MLILGHCDGSGLPLQGYDVLNEHMCKHYLTLEGDTQTEFRMELKPEVREQNSMYEWEKELRLKQRISFLNLKRMEAISENQKMLDALLPLWNNFCLTSTGIKKILEKQKDYAGEQNFPDFHPDNDDETNSFLWAASLVEKEFMIEHGMSNVDEMTQERDEALRNLRMLYQTSSSPEVQESGLLQWIGVRTDVPTEDPLGKVIEVFPTPNYDVALPKQRKSFLTLIDPNADEKVVNETFSKNVIVPMDSKYHKTTYRFTKNNLITIEQMLRNLK